jgi:hypothetical protein
MKIKPVWHGSHRVDDSTVVGWSFHCPGCGRAHVFYVQGKLVWTFNGDHDRPTFEPSLLNRCPPHVDPKMRVCHLTLTAGVLTFHPDCTHDLAGQSVPLPESPD